MQAVLSFGRGAAALFLGLVLALVTMAAAGAAPNDDAYTKTVDGVVVYLGVVPAAIIRGHSAQHPEATMHGGARNGWDRHVVIALFDAKAFERITEADIMATVEGLGHVGRVTKKLERMDIAGAVTFGNYFPFQGTDKYKILLEIKFAGRTKAIAVAFDYST